MGTQQRPKYRDPRVPTSITIIGPYTVKVYDEEKYRQMKAQYYLDEGNSMGDWNCGSCGKPLCLNCGNCYYCGPSSCPSRRSSRNFHKKRKPLARFNWTGSHIDAKPKKTEEQAG